ncbi:MAG TPA: hypothetical protein VG268_18035 [Streptosporangiaceae bacterium]|nr:hypothetical protein [Streptosporangiaceae bacterium]
MTMTSTWPAAERDRTPEDKPALRRTGAALRPALEDVSPPGDEFSRHIAAAVALLRSGVPGLAPAPGRTRLGNLS